MAAVGLYALPTEARDPMTMWAKQTLQPIVQPYILLTSQWQQWNLFSPDPLQRVVTYGIDLDRDGRWERIRSFTPGMESTFRHAAQFKLFGRLLEGNANTLPLVDRFLQLQCVEYHLAAGSRIRLVYHWYILPHPPRALSIAEWSQLHPQPMTFIGSEILCGWPSGTGIYRAFSS